MWHESGWTEGEGVGDGAGAGVVLTGDPVGLGVGDGVGEGVVGASAASTAMLATMKLLCGVQ